MSSLILVNNSQFGGVVRLESLAYDIALQIRQAQVYGISVARFGTNRYDAGYGANFNLSSPYQYVFFADASNPNGLYDIGTNELAARTDIAAGYRIVQLCATLTGQSEVCQGISRLDIVFQRPEPDAWIAVNGTSCLQPPGNVCYESGRIIVQSPKGDLMSILVDVNGQIQVRKYP